MIVDKEYSELMLKWRAVTGWTKEKVNDELKKINCDYSAALDFFLATGRIPNKEEGLLIESFGSQALLYLSGCHTGGPTQLIKEL